MTPREVYPNAPIVLAAIEVRHTQGEPLDAEGQRRLTKALHDLPLRTEGQNVDVVFPPNGPPLQNTTAEYRFSSRDRRTVVTFNQSSLVVQTTDYTRFEDLRALLERAVEARAATLGTVGVVRIGLRYIDEIRVPLPNNNTTELPVVGHERTAETVSPWATWVHPSLFGPVEIAETLNLTTLEAQGVMAFERPSSSVAATGAEVAGDVTSVAHAVENRPRVVVRYGPGDGYAVASTPDLRRPMPSPGPFFLLDIDSFWEPAEAGELALNPILDAVDDLHGPVRDVFESLITERLRKEVLRAHH